MRAILDGFQSTVWTALPATVISFDPTEMTVKLQPTIQEPVPQPDGTIVPTQLPVLIHCPVVFPGNAAYVLTFPLAAGDEGLVVFASRCIDAWWQQGGVQPPAENRMHDLSDGFFIPGGVSKPHAPPAISTASVQLRSHDGTTYVEIKGQAINIVAPAGVKITGTEEETGNLKLDANLEVVGNTALDGTLQVGGGVVVKRILFGSATLNFGVLGFTFAQQRTISVPGAKPGDAVVIGFNMTQAVGLAEQTVYYTAWVSANDTVTVQAAVGTTGGVTVSSKVYSATVFGTT